MKNIQFNVHIEDYHFSENYSDYAGSTALKEANKSLRHYKTYIDTLGHSERKSYFGFGNAFELALIDPKSFKDKVVVFNDQNRPEPDKTFGSKLNKEWKENFYIENSGKYIINATGPESLEVLQIMVSNCLKDEVIKKSLSDTSLQPSFFYTHESGLKIKARPDIAKQSVNNIIDIKTIDDASPKNVAKQIKSHNYTLQASLQIYLAEKTGYMPQVNNYYWLFVEKSGEFLPQLYRFDEQDQEFAMKELEKTIERVSNAIKTNVFPGYSEFAQFELNENMRKYGILTAKIY